MTPKLSITHTLRANYNKRIRYLLKALAEIDKYIGTCYKDDHHTIYTKVTELTRKGREGTFKK